MGLNPTGRAVWGTGLRDFLLGGNGNDTLSDPDGVVWPAGEGGDDSITLYFAPGWNDNGCLALASSAISGGNGDDVIRVTSNNSSMRFDVSGDGGRDRIELEGTWDCVRVYVGNGIDTLKNRGIGSLELFGIELQV